MPGSGKEEKASGMKIIVRRHHGIHCFRNTVKNRFSNEAAPG
jgi:hypothetical protein